MKKPKPDLGPKLNSAMAQPQMMMTRGVRQFERLEAGQRSSTDVDMRIPNYSWAEPESAAGFCYGELMHVHGNPNRNGWKNFLRIAAMQIRAASPDELTIEASGEAQSSMLHLICSI